MANEDIIKILLNMMNIKQLRLRFCNSITSLSFLSTIKHLSNHLEDFTLCICGTLPKDEIIHIKSLNSLRILQIKSTFEENGSRLFLTEIRESFTKVKEIYVDDDFLYDDSFGPNRPCREDAPFPYNRRHNMKL